MRFVPGRTTEEAFEALKEFVGPLASLKLIDASGAADVVLDHPLVQELLRNEPLEIEAKQAWTDVAQLQSVGIPGINFGPGVAGRTKLASDWSAFGCNKPTMF